MERAAGMPEKLRKSSAVGSIPGIVTGHSGIVTAIPENTPKSVTFKRNRRSRSPGTTGHDQYGMGGHDGPEYAQRARLTPSRTGVSQARAMSEQICSAVKVGGVPERGSSLCATA
jgi:hypothetical protein